MPGSSHAGRGSLAFGLLTLSVWLGLSMSVKLLSRRGAQKVLLGWHQTLVWTGLGMVALHGLALVLDPTLHFGLTAGPVPGAAPWRPHRRRRRGSRPPG